MLMPLIPAARIPTPANTDLQTQIERAGDFFAIAKDRVQAAQTLRQRGLIEEARIAVHQARENVRDGRAYLIAARDTQAVQTHRAEEDGRHTLVPEGEWC